MLELEVVSLRLFSDPTGIGPLHRSLDPVGFIVLTLFPGLLTYWLEAAADRSPAGTCSPISLLVWNMLHSEYSCMYSFGMSDIPMRGCISLHGNCDEYQNLLGRSLDVKYAVTHYGEGPTTVSRTNKHSPVSYRTFHLAEGLS